MAEILPETPTAAARTLIAGLALGCAFRCVDKFAAETWVDSAVSAIAAISLTIVDYKLSKILSWAGPQATERLNRVAGDPRWWIAFILVLLLQGALSPLIEEKRLPFAQWFKAPPVIVHDVVHEPATAEEIDKAAKSKIEEATNQFQQRLAEDQKTISDLKRSLAPSEKGENKNAIPQLQFEIQPLVPTDRIILPFGPEYIFKLIGDGTYSEEVIKPYIGKWIVVKTLINSISASGDDRLLITSYFNDNPKKGQIMMYFNKENLRKVILYKDGDEISALCRINSTYSEILDLMDCELEDKGKG
jgi:hypothetical protein